MKCCRARKNSEIDFFQFKLLSSSGHFGLNETEALIRFLKRNWIEIWRWANLVWTDCFIWLISSLDDHVKVCANPVSFFVLWPSWLAFYASQQQVIQQTNLFIKNITLFLWIAMFAHYSWQTLFRYVWTLIAEHEYNEQPKNNFLIWLNLEVEADEKKTLPGQSYWFLSLRKGQAFN